MLTITIIGILFEKGMNSDEILDIIEYIETHDPKEDNNKSTMTK